jgi:hypothetical protein
MSRPRLTLLCEVDDDRLEALLAEPTLATIRRLTARVSLALPEFSNTRSETIRRLSDTGVPVVGWLLLPADAGVYFNVENVSAAEARWKEFLLWTEDEGLSWDAIAFDFEPLCGLSKQLSSKRQTAKFAWKATSRAFAGAQFRDASARYAALITEAHERRIRVESYVLPLVADDRRATSDCLHRMSGTPRVEVDHETIMVYTSFERRLGPALLADYSSDAQGVAVGVTGAPAGVPRLSWAELEADLLLASRRCIDITIHSLEGLVEYGMLGRLESVDWTLTVSPGASRRAVISGTRRAVQFGLRSVSSARRVGVDTTSR